MFSSVLVANRGEIACRVIRTLRKLGIQSIAVYSDADQFASHRLMADRSFHIGPAESKHSYLNQDRLIEIIKESGAQAVHPGYGFLSENPEFAKRVKQAGAIFIGPDPEVIEKLGDKIASRNLAIEANVPVVPGTSFELNSDSGAEALRKFASESGYPILIKAAAGGGGRGMRRVDSEAELEEAVKSASREAEAFFGNGEVFVEKLVDPARHVEVQILGDGQGNCFHLFDRDCSSQRSHQKVIEEAPAPGLSEKLRSSLYQASISLCSKVGYTGAGTVEFLVDQSENFYFLEVNSRLQVEHGVTELVTDLDLVELQLKAASGADLSAELAELPFPTSHAIECRICAESPENNFAPASGRLLKFRCSIPEEYSGRIDTGFEEGDSISHYYDSLIAKLMICSEDRNTAILGCYDTLTSSQIAGLATNCGYLSRLLLSDEFQSGGLNVQYAHKYAAHDSVVSSIVREYSLFAQLWSVMNSSLSDPLDPWNRRDSWRVNQEPISFENSWSILGQINSCTITPVTEHTFAFNSDDLQGEISLLAASDEWLLFLLDGKEQLISFYRQDATTVWVSGYAGSHKVQKKLPRLKQGDEEHSELADQIASPLPGTVIKVNAEEGSDLSHGDVVIVLESMKMEHQIKAPRDGKLAQLMVATGDAVEANAVLAILD